MARLPNRPPISLFHLVSTPPPNAAPMPMPVTTTRLIGRLVSRRNRRRSGLGVALDETDRVAHGLDLLGRVVGNFDAELFFERHHQFDRVEAVGAEIVDELGIFLD